MPAEGVLDRAPVDRPAAVVAHVVVLCGGDAPSARARELVAPASVVLAADSGLHHARALGLDADRIIGDFDSASPASVARAEARGAVLERHPTAKDATDLELALDRAVALGADDIVVLGGGGGRLDHLLVNVTLLAAPWLRGRRVRAALGPALVQILHGPGTVALAGDPGDLVSLVPLGGAGCGITTTGLRYPLVDEDLPFGTSRGVSNELADAHAEVRMTSGTVAVVQPHWGDRGAGPGPDVGPDAPPTVAPSAG
jgi:thiamine pyrophosphokinase